MSAAEQYVPQAVDWTRPIVARKGWPARYLGVLAGATWDPHVVAYTYSGREWCVMVDAYGVMHFVADPEKGPQPGEQSLWLIRNAE